MSMTIEVQGSRLQYDITKFGNSEYLGTCCPEHGWFLCYVHLKIHIQRTEIQVAGRQRIALCLFQKMIFKIFSRGASNICV